MRTRDRTLRALRSHRVPAWWSDAKLGIFVHWTPASVPAFAPVDDEIVDLLASGRRDALGWSPYTEWYENSLNFPDSPAARYHRERYGDRPYTEFARDWRDGLATWDPEDWAQTFARCGARYVVLVAKHADGFCLWPTDVRNPHRDGWTSGRDVVGELAEAVRGAGMRFGVYYSGGLDTTFEPHPMGSMSSLLAAIPRGDYPAYAEAQVRELIARYRPSVLWNDIAWPAPGRELWPLLAHYYDAVPDGVVNDRWMPWSPAIAAARVPPVSRLLDAAVARQARQQRGIIPPRPPHYDVRTPEYTTFDDVQREPWECVRGIDKSFGYNAQSRPSDFLARDELLWSFVDIVAKNGNLLLNVGPKGSDASIPEQQRERLDWLAAWLVPRADLVRGTRPWVTPGDRTAEGTPVRFAARDETVFAYLREPAEQVTLTQVRPTHRTAVRASDGAPLHWSADRGGTTVTVAPPPIPEEPVVLVLEQVEAA
jgi:alpha-L-fucosidase